MKTRAPRSASYPSYSIEYCLELTTKIYTNFGSGNYFAKREEIAKVLGISAAHVQTQVSSATQYGLLELKSGDGYKPSSLFRTIYKPVNEIIKREALIQVFKSPELYKSLIATYENETVPAILPLTNSLIHHHNISDTAASKAASLFIENARHFGFLNNNNELLFGDTPQVIENEVYEEEEEEQAQPVNKLPSTVPTTRHTEKPYQENNQYFDLQSPTNSIPFNIPLKGKRTAQIIVPSDVRPADFDFIVNFINLMRQQYE